MHVLLGLIPYTRENLQLAFKPNAFFNELERTSSYKRATLQSALWKAKQRGLVKREGKLITLTAKGLAGVQPFVAQKLGKQVRLMIIFDIPEKRAAARRRLRALLYEWKFKQVQKSVWASPYDYCDTLIEAIQELRIEDCVELYECARLYPKPKQT